MTREEIIERMGRLPSVEHGISGIERIVAVAVEAEREAILEHCEAMRRAHTGYQAPPGLMQLIDAIRARGEK